MRIYGGRDYYDCGLSLGIDPLTVLIRNKDTTISADEIGGSLFDRHLEVRTPSTKYYAPQQIGVVFCDTLYRGLCVSIDWKNEYFWSAEKLSAWAASEKLVITLNRNWTSKGKVTVEEYLAPRTAPSLIRNYMIANKIAILVEEEKLSREMESILQVNPFTLKKIGFAKALDPYTAFQELSMWIGGVLGGSSPDVVSITDDKVLSESHGFDKHSFRSSSR